MTDEPIRQDADAETAPNLLPSSRGGAKGVFANAGIMLGGKSANTVFNLAYLAITARALGAEAFGVLVLVHTFALAVGDIAQFQSWQAVLHYGSKPAARGERLDLQRVVRFTLLLDVISGLIGVGFAMAVAGFFGSKLGWPKGVGGAAIPYMTIVFFMVSATPTGVLRLFGRFDLLSFQSTVNSLARLIGAVIAWMIGAKLGGFLVVWYMGTVAAFVVLFGSAVREMARRDLLAGFPLLRGSLTEGFPGIWRFAIATNVNTTLEMVFTRVGVLIVGALLHSAAAAMFRIGWQVANVIAGLVKMVIGALYPEMARLWADQDHRGLWKVTVRVGLISGAVGTVLVLVAAFAGGPLLGVVLGPSFQKASEVMTWLVAAAMVNAWALPLEPLLISTGRAGAAVKVRIAASALYLLAIVPLVRRFGLDGAGLCSVIAALVMAAGMTIYVAPWRMRAAARTNPAPRAD